LINNPVLTFNHIIELDVEGCFDNIKHDWIMENIPFIPKPILSSWLNCGFILAPKNKSEKWNYTIYPTTKGVLLIKGWYHQPSY
jgi:retron-type reverse transcriptase